MDRAKRTAGWLVLAATLVAAIWGMYRLIPRMAPLGPDYSIPQLILPLLAIATVGLALALAGVLIRNLVRLILERKRGLLGSRLRTKLVFFFLAFVLFPALFMFYGTAAVIRLTVNELLKAPVADAMAAAGRIVDTWARSVETRCVLSANRVAQEIRDRGWPSQAQPGEIRVVIESSLGRESLDYLEVVSADGRQALVRSPTLERSMAGADSLRATSAIAREACRTNQPMTAREAVGDGLLVLTAVDIPPLAGDVVPPPCRAVIAGSFLGPDLASRMLQITAGGAAFRQFGAQRANLVRMYLSLAAAILLATAFVATWIGFYLSRRITVPMEEVAAAAREISSGNLGVRVVADQGDEVGMLVEAFNDMAAQLQESREVITRSTADLRRSNQALDERRRYIETLVANLSTAVVSLDREGRISTANPAAEEILGIGLPPGEEFPRLLEREGLATLREFVTQPVPRAGEIRRSDLVLTPRGESMTVSAHLTALRGPSQRETQGLLIMLEDLTELMRAQRMAAWSEVARRMAHDIKNPLTPIQLAAQRLRKKFDESAPDFPDVLTDATASIEHEVAVLKGLVDEFSRFARMPEVVLRLVDFAGIVDSVVALYQGLPGIRWEVEVESGMPQVQVDPEQMRRVLVNLIDNAVAAMSGEGSVRIAVRAGSGPGSLRLEVADTGPGILPGDRSKLFLPYFSTKRRGTGLGLAIVHRIISDHLGTIRAEDNRPRGAKFVIEIPG